MMKTAKKLGQKILPNVIFLSVIFKQFNTSKIDQSAEVICLKRTGGNSNFMN